MATQFLFFGNKMAGFLWVLFNYTVSLCIHVHTFMFLRVCKCMYARVCVCVYSGQRAALSLPHLLSILIFETGSLTEWIWLVWLVSKSQGATQTYTTTPSFFVGVPVILTQVPHYLGYLPTLNVFPVPIKYSLPTASTEQSCNVCISVCKMYLFVVWPNNSS